MLYAYRHHSSLRLLEVFVYVNTELARALGVFCARFLTLGCQTR